MQVQDRVLITQIMQPLRGSYSTFRYHNPGPTTHPRGTPQLGDFTQWFTSISRASLARGNPSLVLLNSSSIDRDLATSPRRALVPASCRMSSELLDLITDILAKVWDTIYS
jgi:hypothetical protein